MSVVDHTSIELSPRISEAVVADYVALLKPRVMSLVVFTALVGLVIAPVHVHPVLAFTSILCIAVGAGASGALNMWYEADIDALMSRTANRPIPRGRITPQIDRQPDRPLPKLVRVLPRCCDDSRPLGD